MPVQNSWPLLPDPTPPVGGAVGGGSTTSSGVVVRTGGGLIRPFQRDKKNDFAVGVGNPLLASRIGQIIGTEVGELEYDMEFGSRVNLLRHRGPTFDSETLDALARFYVIDAVRRFETGARITTVTVRLLPAGNGEELFVKFVPVDTTGKPIGAEQSVSVPL